MPRLQLDIRDLPEGPYERLRAIAHQRHQTMTAFVRDELVAIAGRTPIRAYAPPEDAPANVAPVPWERRG